MSSLLISQTLHNPNNGPLSKKLLAKAIEWANDKVALLKLAM